METHQYLLNLQLKLSQRLLMAPPLQHPQEDWDRELIWSSISNCEALFSTWFSYRIPSPALPCFLLREAGPLSSLLWILLINFCICWVFCLPSFLPSFQAFSSCKKWGLNSRCCAQASHCGHFSYCRTWALEHRLSRYGAWAQLLRGMLDLPRAGIKAMSLVLASVFRTTEPPGKSYTCFTLLCPEL